MQKISQIWLQQIGFAFDNIVTFTAVLLALLNWSVGMLRGVRAAELDQI